MYKRITGEIVEAVEVKPDLFEAIALLDSVFVDYTITEEGININLDRGVCTCLYGNYIITQGSVVWAVDRKFFKGTYKEIKEDDNV